ncbi:penicillin-binding protein [Roseivirga sp. BDSF3-8]|uniref:penicillin-binding protein n=1 Tax=Roseivirga sp. BDSF3-8 TaxID=3241598 RepID=UPI003531DC2A
MNIKKSILLRVRIAFLLIVLFAGAIVFRIVHIQQVEGERWRQKAENIGLKFRTVRATRGNIYSDNGSLLATSLPFYRVAFDPTIADDEMFRNGIDSLCLNLSRYYGDRSPQEYKRRIVNARAKNQEYLVLNRRMINYVDKKKMAEWPIFRKGRLKGGVIFQKDEQRFKPFRSLAARTIGYLNENEYGAGLEYSFNEKLSGRDGEALYQKISGGNWKPVFDGSEVKPIEGLDIETTLDINLQDVVQTSLLKHLTAHRAEYGCAVVMEVQTGEIKAISNLSLNDKEYYVERYNYAVQGVREPGSTFKLASMIALLEDSHLNLNDSIDTGDGKYMFHNQTMRDHKPGGYGKISIEEAFAYSSNIAIAKMVDARFGLNPQRYMDYIKDMGLDRPLGFQMVGEGVPKLKTPGDPTWSGISLPWISHGYEVEQTPLQTLAFYNAIANDGKMITPIIVKKLFNNGRLEKEFEPAVINSSICSRETLKKVRRMLEAVVEYGTAQNINDAYYKIAGKTGTAQKLINGRYSRKYYTSFVGYFPAEAPRYSCIVVIDEPKGYNQYGSDVAAPVFEEIANKIFARNVQLHPPLPTEFVADTSTWPVMRAGRRDDLLRITREMGIDKVVAPGTEEWVHTKLEGDTVMLATHNVRKGIVPDVRGMTLRDAVYLLENCGLQVHFNGNGRVRTQSLLPGQQIDKTQVIKLSLG